jgi:hypothetical protein
MLPLNLFQERTFSATNVVALCQTFTFSESAETRPYHGTDRLRWRTSSRADPQSGLKSSPADKEAGVPLTISHYSGMIHVFIGILFDKSRQALAEGAAALRAAFR